VACLILKQTKARIVCKSKQNGNTDARVPFFFPLLHLTSTQPTISATIRRLLPSFFSSLIFFYLLLEKIKNIKIINNRKLSSPS